MHEGVTGAARCRQVADGVDVREIFDFWLALWHEAWSVWDGLWLFQAGRRPIDLALGWDGSAARAEAVSSVLRSPVVS